MWTRRSQAFIAVLLCLLVGSSAYGQSTGLPLWPQTLPANTVVGRIGAGQAGPAEAIPFLTLQSLLGFSRTPLIANTSYYVNTSTGNDNHAGTSAAPFKTLQHAWNHLSTSLDPGPYTVTINVAAGSYPLQIDADHKFISGEVVILGVGSTSTTIVDFDMEGNHPVGVSIDGVTFKDDGASLHNAAFFTNGLAIFGLGYSGLDDVVFDTTSNTSSFGINPTDRTSVFINDMTAKGNAAQILNPADHGTSISVGQVTFSGTPVYSVGVAQVFEGHLNACGPWVGSVTGPKYQVGDGGVINACTTTFPGTIEGQVFGTGIYNGPDTNVIFTPTTGNTITMVNLRAIIKPAGTLSALTIDLPVTTSGAGTLWWPNNNAVVTVGTTQTLTSLTIATTDGTTIVNPITTLTAGHAFKLIYDSTTTSWYPLD